MSLTNCCSPCPTVQTVNTPGVQGDAGTNGTDGVDGVNAFTDITADATVPVTAGITVTVAVSDSSWMVIGQTVIIGDPDLGLASPGPATFKVTAIASATSVTLEWLDYPGDVAGGSTLSDGCYVSPSGEMPLLMGESVAAAGTNAVITNTTAGSALNFGTTDPSLTLTNAGQYLVNARVSLYANALILAGTENLTIRLVESPSTMVCQTVILMTAEATTTRTIMVVPLPPVLYTAATAGKILFIDAQLSVADGGGTLEADEAEIVAVKIAQP